jgi:hypothetical protein
VLAVVIVVIVMIVIVATGAARESWRAGCGGVVTGRCRERGWVGAGARGGGSGTGSVVAPGRPCFFGGCRLVQSREFGVEVDEEVQPLE